MPCSSCSLGAGGLAVVAAVDGEGGREAPWRGSTVGRREAREEARAPVVDEVDEDAAGRRCRRSSPWPTTTTRHAFAEAAGLRDGAMRGTAEDGRHHVVW
ncbi:unnamed protein product [Urochloa humidicola]